jgi:hypothetical protein
VFFSHNKSANAVFQSAYQHNRMGPKKILVTNKKIKERGIEKLTEQETSIVVSI